MKKKDATQYENRMRGMAQRSIEHHPLPHGRGSDLLRSATESRGKCERTLPVAREGNCSHALNEQADPANQPTTFRLPPGRLVRSARVLISSFAACTRSLTFDAASTGQSRPHRRSTTRRSARNVAQTSHVLSALRRDWVDDQVRMLGACVASSLIEGGPRFPTR